MTSFVDNYAAPYCQGPWDPVCAHGYESAHPLVSPVLPMSEEEALAAVQRWREAYPDVVAAARLEEAGFEESDVDPAPELQPGPVHAHVEWLESRAKESAEAGRWLELSRGLEAPEVAFELGYRTAIHDLRERTSEPAVEYGVVLPTGERVPQEE